MIAGDPACNDSAAVYSKFVPARCLSRYSIKSYIGYSLKSTIAVKYTVMLMLSVRKYKDYLKEELEFNARYNPRKIDRRRR